MPELGETRAHVRRFGDEVRRREEERRRGRRTGGGSCTLGKVVEQQLGALCQCVIRMAVAK